MLAGFELIEEGENSAFFRQVCPICYSNERPSSPYWGFADSQALCFQCMEKFAPEILVKNKNKEAWPDWYKEMIAECEKETRQIPEEDRLPF